jgi:carbamoyltransferase
MCGAFLGPDFSQSEIESTLSSARAKFETLDEADVLSRASAELADGKIIGWFQGRMEFGPRALGARSILADPRGAGTQARLNLSTKYRESFRPFAPAVLAEEQDKWFGVGVPSPFMSFVVPVSSFAQPSNSATGLERLKGVDSAVPAVTHVDGTARVQTVVAEQNPLFHALLTSFHARTGCPILVNTSFNIRGEPIVCTPLEAFECFMNTDIDTLVIGNCYLSKSEQNPALRTKAVVSALVD